MDHSSGDDDSDALLEERPARSGPLGDSAGRLLGILVNTS
jgi:hypothetical protein